MKKVFAFVLLVACSFQTFAATITPVQPKAAEIFIPVGRTGQRISLLELSQIDLQRFETLTNRHLGAFDRMSFKLAQRKLRKSIDADGTINNKKLNRLMRSGDHSTGFHMGGFALGFFVGLIGVLIAYLIDDDYKRNRVKWAWIGFGTFMVIYIALLVVLISHLNTIE